MRCRVLLALCALLLLSAAFAPAAEGSTATKEKEVTFANGDISLAGDLLLPAGANSAPGVVIVHGSGRSDRSNPWTSAYAGAFVERGIAVLHPDKRGSGASAGDWREATFSELAGDAIAAVELLGAHPMVDRERVGLIGFSQGGHVIPLAATRSPAVSFVIDVSGSVVPMMEQIGDELWKMGEQEGLTAAELETIQSIHRQGVQYALAGQGWETYAKALAAAEKGPLADSKVLAGFPRKRNSPDWRFLRTIGDFDPLPYWREVDVPVLFLYGGRDENVDAKKSVEIIGDALAPAGLRYSLLFFGNNGHALFREDAMDFIARWIQDGAVDSSRHGLRRAPPDGHQGLVGHLKTTCSGVKFEMKINFTKKEYRLLLELVYVGEWILTAHDDNGNPTKEEHEELAQKIYSYAKEMGYESLFEEAEEFGEFFPTQKFEMESPVHDFIDQYNDDSFWEELIHRLTRRDVEHQCRLEEKELPSWEEYWKIGGPIAEEYSKEFEANGLERLTIRET